MIDATCPSVGDLARARARDSRGRLGARPSAGRLRQDHAVGAALLALARQVEAPERILALTFTRRAAEEMRARVVDALHAARLPECPAEMNRRPGNWGLPPRAIWSAWAWILAQHPARLRIETIDAFNGWLAAQLPILAGTGSRLRTEDSAESLYRDAARRALAYDAEDAYGGAVDRVLALGDCAGAASSSGSRKCCRAGTAGCPCSPAVSRRRAHPMRRSCSASEACSMRTSHFWSHAAWARPLLRSAPSASRSCRG
jgi:hypothetical protein